MIGADEALGELRRDVVLLRRQLAGRVERDRPRAVRGENLAEAVGGEAQRQLPGHTRPLGVPAHTDFRVEQSIVGAQRGWQVHGLRAHVAVAGRGVAIGEHVARDPVVGQDHGGGRSAIVDLVDPGRGDRERSGRDVGRRARRGVERVVAGVGPADRDARYAHRLAGPDVLVGERRAGIAIGDGVAGDLVVG